MCFHISHPSSYFSPLSLAYKLMNYYVKAYLIFPIWCLAGATCLQRTGCLLLLGHHTGYSTDKHSSWSLITWALYRGGSSHSTMLNRTKSTQLSFTASAAALSLVFCHRHQVFFVYQVINSNDVLLLSFVPKPRLLLCGFGRTPSPRSVAWVS